MRLRLTALIIFAVLCIFTQNFAMAVVEIKEGAMLSLEDCIEIALKNSPEINISKNNQKIYKSRIGQAKSDYFPTIGAGGGYYNQNGNTSGNRTLSNNMDYYSMSASLNMMFYNFGKTGAKINMQKFYKIASDFDLDNMRLTTVYNVKTAYYGVLAAQANRQVARSNVAMNERTYNQIKAFFEEGIRSKIDLVNAEVNLSDSKIELVTAEKAYQTALVKLNNSMYTAYAPAYSIKNTESFNFKNNVYTDVNLVNIADTKDLSATPKQPKNAVFTSSVEKSNILKDYVFKPFDMSFDETVKTANEKRPDLKSYESTFKAMEESLKYTKREYFPSLSGRAGYGYRSMDGNTTNSFNLSATLETSNINIMNTKCKIDEAKAQLEIARENVNLIKQNIYFEVQSAYIDMKQIEERLPLLAVKVRQTLENYELADGRYEVGVGNYIELQDAKVNYNNAQQAYVKAIYDYNVARAALEKAMGES